MLNRRIYELCYNKYSKIFLVHMQTEYNCYMLQQQNYNAFYNITGKDILWL